MSVEQNTGMMPWYGLCVRSKSEQLSATALRGKGYDPFVPSYKARRRWSDRVKEIELPLFPGYVFCRLNTTNRLPVLTSPGVVGIVRIGKVPVPIEESEIEAIRAVVASGLASRPSPFPRTGDRVRVCSGPLRGVEGVVTRVDDRQSLVVSITLLQRAVAVKLDESWVRTVH
jgi:transcription antitermination factor NusG